MTKRPRDYTPEEELRIRAEVKAELRKRMRAIRRALPADARASRSAEIAARVAALPEYARAGVVAAFFPLAGEVDLRPLFARVLADGKTLALPRVDLDSEELVLHRWSPGEPLEEGPYGLREPLMDSETIDPATLDLVVCPALALDEAGYRIGYGRGYYDRLLPRCTRAYACAVAFDFQLVAEVPTTPGDVPAHAIVTDARTVVVGS